MRLLKTLKHCLNNPNAASSASTKITIDDAFRLLANDRRRHVIRILSEVDDEMTIRELSQRLADIENTSRKTVHIALYQTHLPALADGDSPAIRYDTRTGVVTPTATCHLLDRIRIDSQELLNS